MSALERCPLNEVSVKREFTVLYAELLIRNYQWLLSCNPDDIYIVSRFQCALYTSRSHNNCFYSGVP